MTRQGSGAQLLRTGRPLRTEDAARPTPAPPNPGCHTGDRRRPPGGTPEPGQATAASTRDPQTQPTSFVTQGDRPRCALMPMSGSSVPAYICAGVYITSVVSDRNSVLQFNSGNAERLLDAACVSLSHKRREGLFDPYMRLDAPWVRFFRGERQPGVRRRFTGARQRTGPAGPAGLTCPARHVRAVPGTGTMEHRPAPDRDDGTSTRSGPAGTRAGPGTPGRHVRPGM